jgi:hypothetical protein
VNHFSIKSKLGLKTVIKKREKCHTGGGVEKGAKKVSRII